MAEAYKNHNNIETICKQFGYTRERLSFESGVIEFINAIDVTIRPEFAEEILKEQTKLLKGKSAKLHCMIVAAGVVFHKWADGVLVTYESAQTNALVGSTNHALAWKDVAGTCVAFDFTAKDSFTSKDKPSVLVIVATDVEQLKQVVGQIYGNDGVNDANTKGWGEQSSLSIEKNEELYVKLYGSFSEKMKKAVSSHF